MKINNNRKVSLGIILVIAVVLLAAGYTAAAYVWHLPPFISEKNTYDPGEQVTNLERSDTEKSATKALEDSPEQKLQNNQTDTPSAPTETNKDGKQVVTVNLTSVGISNGVVNASGMVSNLVEEGGACTYIFTNGTQVVNKSSTTSTNPTSTTCTRITFSANELPSDGTWTVKLNYNSSKAEGVSGVKEIVK